MINLNCLLLFSSLSLASVLNDSNEKSDLNRKLRLERTTIQRFTPKKKNYFQTSPTGTPTKATLAIAKAPEYCEFNDLDVFIVANKENFEFLVIMLNSFDAFMPCFNHMHVVVDEPNKVFFESFLASRKYNATVNILTGRGPTSDVQISPSGYFNQAWIMMWADYYVDLRATNASYVMFLDTDTVFSFPISRATLFDSQGRIYMGGWDIWLSSYYHDHCLDFIGEICRDALGYMSFFPFTYPTQVTPMWNR